MTWCSHLRSKILYTLIRHLWQPQYFVHEKAPLPLAKIMKYTKSTRRISSVMNIYSLLNQLYIFFFSSMLHPHSLWLLFSGLDFTQPGSPGSPLHSARQENSFSQPINWNRLADLCVAYSYTTIAERFTQTFWELMGSFQFLRIWGTFCWFISSYFYTHDFVRS